MSIRTALFLSRRTAPGFAVIGVCWGTLAATIPAIKAQIGASDALFGLLLLASAFGLLSAAFLAPRLDVRLGRYALPGAAGLFLLAIPFLGVAATPSGFALALAGVGAASGITDILVNARVSELEARHGQALMNFNHAIFSFAYAAAAIVAGLCREAGLDPAAIFAVPAVATALVLPLLVIAPDQDPGDRTAAPSALPFAPIFLCGGIVLLAFMTEAAVEAWAALHVERTLGGRAAEGALGPAMLGLTMGIGRLSGHLVAERLDDRAVARAGAAMAGIGALVAAAAPSPVVAYLGFAVTGLGISVVGPIGLAMVGRMVPPAVRTRAIARTAVIGFSGFFIAPPLIGITSELYGLRVAFICISGVAFCVPLLLLPRRSLARVDQ